MTEVEEVQSRITTIEQQRAAVNAQLKTLRDQALELRMELIQAEADLGAAGLRHLGLSIGDEIIAHAGRPNECRAHVVACRVKKDEVWLEANPINKNGKVSPWTLFGVRHWRRP